MKCDNCGKEISIWQTSYSINSWSVCADCHKNHYDEIKAKAEKESKETQHIKESNPEPEIAPEVLDKILLTTETYPENLKVEERYGIISAEVALGMNMFRDMFTDIRDLFGGKSISTQKVLKDLKENAFKDLKKQAYNLNANAVIATDLNYSEFAGLKRSMLFLVVTGTAVKLKKENPNKDQT